MKATYAFVLALLCDLAPRPALLCQETDNASKALRLEARGDTTGAIEAWRRAVTAEPSRSDYWYRLGSLASHKSRPFYRRAFVRRGTDIDVMRLADSALYRATQLAPDSAPYLTAYAEHLIHASPGSFGRAAKLLDQAIVAARGSGDRGGEGRALDLKGMIAWRRYEQVADRYVLRNLTQLSFEAFLEDPRGVGQFIANEAMRLEPPLGNQEFTNAFEDFRGAVEADPENMMARRHLFMLAAEKKNWTLLRTEAELLTERSRDESLGWLALGLASHRIGDELGASRAFGTALSLLTPAERARFTALSRLLRQSDSVGLASLKDNERTSLERIFWLTADPSLLVPGNVYWLEFLSRVTYANLRWTVEQLKVRGEDSDRGTIYIRYGPPPTIAGFAPPLESRPHCSMISGQLLCEAVSSTPAGNGYVLWYYPDINLHFVFQAPPTYGTASLASQYLEVAEEMRQKAPTSWTNLQIARNLLEKPIPVQLTRFRGPADSVDLFVTAAVPIEQLRHGVGADSTSIGVSLSLFDAAGNALVTDTVSEANEMGVAQARAWRKRLPKRPEALYRLDALQKTSLRSAKSMGKIRLDLGSGFGLSDLLVATSLAPRESAAKWSDMLIAPSTGSFRVGDPIAILWETYGLRESDSGHAYRVAISVRRIEEKGAVAVATRIIGGIREAVMKSHGEPSPILTYERRVPSTGRSLDYLTIGSEGLSAGSYEIHVQVTDKATGTSAKTQARVRLIRGT